MNNSNFDKNSVEESRSHWLKYNTFVKTAYAIYFGWAFFKNELITH